MYLFIMDSCLYICKWNKQCHINYYGLPCRRTLWAMYMWSPTLYWWSVSTIPHGVQIGLSVRRREHLLFCSVKEPDEMVVIYVTDSDCHYGQECLSIIYSCYGSKTIIKKMQWSSLSAITYFLLCGILLVNVNIAHTANL